VDSESDGPKEPLDGVQIPHEKGAILRGKLAARCKVYGHSAVSGATTAQPIEMLFGMWTIWWAFIRCGSHWRHLANTTEPSVCGDNVALCQMTLTTCYYYYFLTRSSNTPGLKREKNKNRLKNVYVSVPSSTGKVLWNRIELNRCISTLIR